MPRLFVLALLCGVALACAGKPAPTPDPVADPAALRTPAAGPVQGFRGGYGAHAWLGIPFAQPPEGALRWRAPQPLAPWQEPRAALAFGAACPQLAGEFGVDAEVPAGAAIGDEDCLYLNIYAPVFEPDAVPTGAERRPVLFWIHGGGNTTGAASFYDGGHLAAAEDVVVVTVNYRLGPFGWFRHPALAEGASAAEQSGNFGTLDLIHALGWVRDHIAAFGGDPGNVTVFGESAGGRNVVQLLLSPLARGLFQRAIVQSGGTRSNTIAEAENYADASTPGHAKSSREVALALLARGEARDAARAKVDALPAGEIAAQLRATSAPALLAVYEGGNTGFFDLPQVFRDGVVLPLEPFPALFERPGAVAPVPVVFGTNKDENKLFLFFDPKYVRRWFGVVPQIQDRDLYLLTADYQSRIWKASGADQLAMSLARAGHEGVYVYRFDWDEEPKLLWFDLGELIGAAHAFEIPFVFGHWDLGPQSRRLYDDANLPGREALSTAMMSYWAQFARSGAPGQGSRGDLPLWSAWNPADGAGKFVVLDTPAGGGVRMASDAPLTHAALVAELTRDPRLPDEASRCALLATLVAWSPDLDESHYAAGGCEGHPSVAGK